MTTLDRVTPNPTSLASVQADVDTARDVAVNTAFDGVVVGAIRG